MHDNMQRQEIHSRQIDLRFYSRPDGLYEVEGRLIDKKAQNISWREGTNETPVAALRPCGYAMQAAMRARRACVRSGGCSSSGLQATPSQASTSYPRCLRKRRSTNWSALPIGAGASRATTKI